jgi:superfamily II DNA/RNA helicase
MKNLLNFLYIKKQLIDQAIEGFTTTVLAYGQTGSGKTYT